MVNRVSYLAKEEQRFLKKIIATRDKAEKQNYQQSEKVLKLQEKIELEQRQKEEFQTRIIESRIQREQAQGQRLKLAYDRMLQFESERQNEKADRAKQSEHLSIKKTSIMAKKFQMAENIR